MSNAKSRPPNIVYIHSHDTGRYVSPYGHAFRTPNLMAFARQGVLFRQAFCANPTCSPSRAALLTGQWAHCSGMIGLAHRGFGLNDHRRHIVHTLRDAGYRSYLMGVQHVAGKHVGGAESIGYDKVINAGPARSGVVDVEAARFLRDAPSEPFFLDAGFFETHRVFPSHEPEDDPRYLRPPAPLPDTPETRRDMADYATTVHHLDNGIGNILRAIDEAGLADRTLVIITTDHGIAFPLMKCNLTDHGLGVMLLMRGPGGFDGGRVIDAMVSHVDVFPTLCEVVGAAKPAWLSGTSMMPLIRGEAESIRDEIFAEVNFHAALEPQRSVRTSRYKYIRRYATRPTPVLPNCDESVSKDVLLGRGWAERPLDAERLYDLTFDPHEGGNVADRPEYQAALREMRGRLDRWMRETDDPLLKGPLELPKGAAVNPAAGRSPQEPTVTDASLM